MSTADALVVDPARAGAGRRPHLRPERSRLRLRRRGNLRASWRASCRATRCGSPATWCARSQTAAAILAAGRSRSHRRRRAARRAGPSPSSTWANGRAWSASAFYAERKVGTHTLWFAPADERPPGGESFADLIERVVPAIERLNDEHRGRDIVAVTHGGTIRAALALALGLTPQAALAFSVENCSLTRIDHLDRGRRRGLWRVVAVNHRPWSRTPAADHLGHNPVAIDKA